VTDRKPLLYHDDADHLRRDLMAAHLDMMRRSETYMSAKLAGTEVPMSEAVSDAWQAATAAWNTSYVLAAVLGVAAKEFGPKVADRLAYVADDLLANGDDHDWNADVAPEPEQAATP
jgi:hypothetical protein